MMALITNILQLLSMGPKLVIRIYTLFICVKRCHERQELTRIQDVVSQLIDVSGDGVTIKGRRSGDGALTLLSRSALPEETPSDSLGGSGPAKPMTTDPQK